jgi:hypothetical protein
MFQNFKETHYGMAMVGSDIYGTDKGTIISDFIPFLNTEACLIKCATKTIAQTK